MCLQHKKRRKPLDYLTELPTTQKEIIEVMQLLHEDGKLYFKGLTTEACNHSFKQVQRKFIPIKALSAGSILLTSYSLL